MQPKNGSPLEEKKGKQSSEEKKSTKAERGGEPESDGLWSKERRETASVLVKNWV